MFVNCSYYRAEDQDNLLTKESDHLVNVIARAKNAILNAVGDSSETFTTDIKNMIEEGKIEQYLKDDSTEDDEQDGNVIPIIVDINEQKEKEKQEDVQVSTQNIFIICLHNVYNLISSYLKSLQQIRPFLRIFWITFLTIRK